MNPHYYNIIVNWINANDIYIAFAIMIFFSLIGLFCVVKMYVDDNPIMFGEDGE